MKQAVVTSFALFALLGCSTEPVRIVDYEDQPVTHFGSHGISIEEVQIDVRMAAAKASWNVAPSELPGQLTATRADGKTSATVNIIFDLNKYSIKYKSSASLDYTNGCADKTPDGLVRTEGKCISPTYNEWVAELNKEISQKLQY